MLDEIKNGLNNKNAIIISLDETESTSTYIRNMLPCEENAIVTAVSQTGGRGRNGKSFYSPAGTGLYVSFLLNPNCSLTAAVSVTTRTAVIAARIIEEITGKEIKIKWVNDLYYNDKKVCGILCEAINDYKQCITKSLIIGIGINLSTESFPQELSGIAGSLEINSTVKSKIIAALANELFAMRLGDLEPEILDEYRKRSTVIGKNINYFMGEQKNTAYVLDVDGDGGLIILNEDGKIGKLNSGEISLRY